MHETAKLEPLSLDDAELPLAERIGAMRFSIVCQRAQIPTTALALMKKAQGRALAFNARQKLWLVQKGVLRLSENELSRASWKVVINARSDLHGVTVKSFPINRLGGCTKEELLPYFEDARNTWAEFEALATDPVDGSAEDEDDDEGGEEADEDQDLI